MLRICKRCDQEFDGIKEQRLCPACRDAARKMPRVGERVCKTCGTVFEGGPRAWYCPVCRAERYRIAKSRHNATWRAGKTRKIGSTDICINCGAEYIVDSGTQRYCRKCAPEVIREKTLPMKREYAKKKRQAEPDYKRKLKENGTICKICGKAFTASSKHFVVCSEECAAEAKRLNQAIADRKRKSNRNPNRKRPDNAQKPPIRAKSGVRGVYQVENGRWRAVYKSIHLGMFATIEEAAEARRKAEEQNSREP